VQARFATNVCVGKAGRFVVAGKKSPVYMSICAGLSIVRTTATFWRTHFTSHLDISLEMLFLIDTIIPLPKELSIVSCAASKTYCRVEESQNAIPFNEYSKEIGIVDEIDKQC